MSRKKKTRYSKERARIVRYLSKLKKQGRRIDLYVPTELELRKQGVKGTELFKLTRKLKLITPKELRDITHEIPNPTQESTNTTGFEPPKNISEDDTFFENVVISSWYGLLMSFSNGEAYELLHAWMDSIVRDNGKHDTAIMLQDGAEAGHLLTWEVVYKKDKAVSYIGYMIDYLPEAGVLYKEEMMDNIEFMKRMNDAIEQDEDWENPV